MEVASRLLCAVALVLALPVALTVGMVAGTGAAVRAQEEAASRHRITAVLARDAPPAEYSRRAVTTVTTAATWPVPGGGSRDGWVGAPRDARVGDRVPIWVDAAGSQVDPPLDAAGVADVGMRAGALALLGVAALAGGGHLVVRRVLDGHRPGSGTGSGGRSPDGRRASGDRPVPAPEPHPWGVADGVKSSGPGSGASS
jgi:hypothetical protein